jgi:NAD(P)-dependent dehydrogenase (short-subunit alcohol dehydrogenase family)
MRRWTGVERERERPQGMARWTPEQMPSPAGLRVVVTGSNTGIGYEAAKVFAERGAHVTLACRNMEKADAAKDRILSASPSGTVDAMMLDLADLESVQAFADAFLAQHERLDRLVLNAGVMIPPLGRTAQGFELQFGVNHLGHFALTCHLDPLLRATEGARVTAVTSVAGDMGRMHWDDVNWEQRKYVRWQAYGQSKLANQLFVRGLAARVPYATTLAHPGWSRTDLQRHSSGASAGNVFLRPFTMNAAYGAWPTLRAAMEPDVGPAAYFGAKGLTQLRGPPRPRKHAKRARKDEDVERLWALSEGLTGLRLA